LCFPHGQLDFVLLFAGPMTLLRMATAMQPVDATKLPSYYKPTFSFSVITLLYCIIPENIPSLRQPPSSSDTKSHISSSQLLRIWKTACCRFSRLLLSLLSRSLLHPQKELQRGSDGSKVSKPRTRKTECCITITLERSF